MTAWSINGPDRELWTIADVCRHFGWGRSKFHKLIRDGHFPRGRDIGGRPMWTGDDIAAYLLLAGRWHPGDDEEDKPDE